MIFVLMNFIIILLYYAQYITLMYAASVLLLAMNIAPNNTFPIMYEE